MNLVIGSGVRRSHLSAHINGSIRLLVQNLTCPEEEPLSGFDCNPSKTPITTPVSDPIKVGDRIDLRV